MFDFRKLPSATAFAMWPKRPYYSVLSVVLNACSFRSFVRTYVRTVRSFVCSLIFLLKHQQQ